MTGNLRTFDSDGSTYDEVFRLFLAHTDQKARANEWLGHFIAGLPSRKLFVDMGAGEGTVTRRLQKQFERTIAIEPNSKLSETLQTIPGIEVLEKKIAEIKDMPPADLVLCSHIFYLLDPSIWLDSINRMASWLSKTGALVIINQNKDTDCRMMSGHFYKNRTDLMTHFDQIKLLERKGYQIRVETIPSYVTAPDLETACRIAEFLLGGKHDRPAPDESDVRTYIKDNFGFEGLSYRLSCHQDFLIINR